MAKFEDVHDVHDHTGIPGVGAGSALTVQEEGSSLATAATTLNFTGAGVTASGTGATKTIDIPGGGGGGSGYVAKAAASAATSGVSNPTTETLVPGLTVTFTGGITVVYDIYVLFTESGGNARFSVYEDGTKIWPVSPSDGQVAQAVTMQGASVVHYSFAAKVIRAVAAGSHTIEVREEAHGGIGTIVFYDRALLVSQV